jgi:ABC-type dipeptide/oligopeptide/nickel transport system permease component
VTAVPTGLGPALGLRTGHAGRSRRLARIASVRALLARTVGRLVVVLFGVLTVLFVLLHSAGDPAAAIAGQSATPEVLARIRHQLGFDRPLLHQYGTYLWNAVRFHFGDSYSLHDSAMSLVMDRLPATLGLIGLGYALALVVALPLGFAGGLLRNRFFDWFAGLVVVAGQAVPVFASGIVLVYLFAVHWGAVPAIAPDGFSSSPSAIVLPVVVLSFYPIARILEVTRSGLAESMQEDYVRTAESKGVGPWRVVSRHAIRPVLTALVTVIGIDLAQMLSGGVLVEVIFAWPGVGPMLVSSVSNRDYPVVEATTFTFAVIVVVINFLMDLLYRRLDPRIRKNGG